MTPSAHTIINIMVIWLLLNALYVVLCCKASDARRVRDGFNV